MNGPERADLALIAHRGFAATYPENTLAAVRGAVEKGADLIEVDVRRCGSGELVVHHDATVDRVTEATGPLQEYTVDELEAMTVFGTREGVPTLAAVVDAVPSTVGLNVELKEEGIAGDAVEQLSDVGQVVVSSFSASILEEVQSCDPSIDRALLVDRRPRAAVQRGVELGVEYLHPRARLCLRSLVVRRAHRAGLGVNVWTVNSDRIAGWLRRLGVDGVITDEPDVLG